MIRRILTTVVATVALLAACEKDAPPPFAPVGESEFQRGPLAISLSPSVLALPPGATAIIAAVLRDSARSSNAADNVTWQSADSSVVSVSNGTVTAVRSGAAIITATRGDLTAQALVHVCIGDERGMRGIDPEIIEPDKPFLIVGCNIPQTIAGLSITVAGENAKVISAGIDGIRAVLPREATTCAATRRVRVELNSPHLFDRHRHWLATARQLPLLKGEAVSIAGQDDAACLELSNPGARYLIGVTNLATQPGSRVALVFGGATGPDVVPESATLPVLTASSKPAVLSAQLQPDAFPDLQAHRVLGATNAAVLAQSRAPGLPSLPQGLAAQVVSVPGEAVGSVHPMRVWMPGGSSCSGFTDVQARTAFVGTRVIVREDTRNVGAVAMDDLLVSIGQEFDASVYPKIFENFGDPLALDARLDANGRVILLVSRAVNEIGGYTSFVIACDFYSPTSHASSNLAEVVYMQAPTSAERGFPETPALTPERWYRSVRNAVMHETKHLASYAERLARNQPTEETWLEEGTAMIAEEIWGRGIYGVGRFANVDYRTSIFCDLRPVDVDCGAKPFVMWDHFRYLNLFENLPELLTPVSQFTATDVSVYGSSWGFLRWIIDHYAASESAFLRALTTSHETGIRNLETVVGRPVRPLLGDWVMSLALDYVPGFSPARRDLSFPSWDTQSIFEGMHIDRPGLYPQPNPLSVHRQTFGTFALYQEIQVNATALFEISGEQKKTQLIGLSISLSTKPFRNFALTVVRIE